MRWRNSDVTPDLVAIVKNPWLDNPNIPATPPRSVPYDTGLKTGPRISKPPAPFECRVDRGVSIVEQLDAVVRRGSLLLYEEDREKLAVAYGDPPGGGVTQELLGQYHFGVGFKNGEVPPRDISSPPSVLADGYSFASYIAKNLAVGMTYEFAMAVPAPDGITVMTVYRSGNMKRRTVRVRTYTNTWFSTLYYLTQLQA